MDKERRIICPEKLEIYYVCLSVAGLESKGYIKRDDIAFRTFKDYTASSIYSFPIIFLGYKFDTFLRGKALRESLNLIEG